MKKDGSTFSSDHPDELLLPYVEQTLGPEEQDRVGKHLKDCPQCSTQADGLRELVAVLRTEKTVFCPESSSLYEFAEHGTDPGESVSKHLETCEVCREEAEAFKASMGLSETLSSDLWAQVRQRLPRNISPERDSAPHPQEKESFFSRFFTQFTLARLAAAAAVAVVMVSVMWRSGEIPQPMVAASSVTWENAPKPKSTEAAGRKRLALIILLKDFSEPPARKTIDKLYEALEPGVDIQERYQLLTPADLKNTVKNLSFSGTGRSVSIATLRKKLDVSLAVLVTIIAAESTFEVHGEVVDTATDRVLSSRTIGPVAKADLAGKTRDIVRDLILRQ